MRCQAGHRRRNERLEPLSATLTLVWIVLRWVALGGVNFALAPACGGTDDGRGVGSCSSRRRDATKTSTMWRNTDLYFFQLHSIRAGSIWIERRYEVWSSSTTCCARHRSRECQ